MKASWTETWGRPLTFRSRRWMWPRQLCVLHVCLCHMSLSICCRRPADSTCREHQCSTCCQTLWISVLQSRVCFIGNAELFNTANLRVYTYFNIKIIRFFNIFCQPPFTLKLLNNVNGSSAYLFNPFNAAGCLLFPVKFLVLMSRFLLAHYNCIKHYNCTDVYKLWLYSESNNMSRPKESQFLHRPLRELRSDPGGSWWFFFNDLWGAVRINSQFHKCSGVVEVELVSVVLPKHLLSTFVSTKPHKGRKRKVLVAFHWFPWSLSSKTLNGNRLIRRKRAADLDPALCVPLGFKH